MSVSSSTGSLVIVGDESTKTNKETKGESGRPEIQSMHMVSNLRNRYARTVVTSKYTNPASNAQQATFSIVLPDTAFIAGFVMEIEGKAYEAYVKEKKQAKQEYDEAVSHGRAAAHVAVSARDSNKFTVSVNVEPKSDVTFILTYEELLVRKHSKYEMVVNLHPGQLLEDLGVDVYINESRPINKVETPAMRSGNEITDKVTKNEYTTIRKNTDEVVHVSFHPTIEQQKEIATALTGIEENPGSSEQSSSNGISGQFVVEYDVERDPQGGEVLLNDGYFVHFFAPTELKPIPKHVIFILDVSGSMSGRKLKQVKEAMKVILNELNPEDYFNLVKFSNNISVLNNNYSWKNIDIPAESKLPQSIVANAKNIKSVQAIVEKIEDEGRTNIYDALIVGVRLTSKGISHLEETDKKHKPQPIIVFLTDGQPNVSESNPKKIVEMVERRNDCDNKSAIFTLAFGDDADKDFLKELAIQNSGFLRNIYEAADASLQLQDFYKQISSPLLTNVNFKYPDEVKEVTNHKFDILFDGSEFVVAGKVDDMVDGFVFVEGSTVEGTNKFCPCIITVCPKPDVKEVYGSLERLWAYMTIKQLLDKKYENKGASNDEDELDNNIKDNSEKEQEENQTEKEIAEKHALKLALKYSFVTPVTSLVVVKPDEPDTEEQLEGSNTDADEYHLQCLNCFSICDPNDSMDDDSTDDDSMYMNCEKIIVHPAGRITCGINQPVSNESLSYYSRRNSVGLGKISRPFPASINQLFTKSKIEAKPGLRSIQVNCTVRDHVATTVEKRTYVNYDSEPQETTFTVDLPDKIILTEFVMKTEGKIFETEKDNKKVKLLYKSAVVSGVDAAFVNLQDSNKVIVTVHIAANSEVILLLKYEKHLDRKSTNHEIVINLHCDACTEEIGVNVFLNESSPIKNVEIPNFEENALINKINDNETHVQFNKCFMLQNQPDPDTYNLGQFIVKYEVEPDPSAGDDSVAKIPASKPFSYLVAFRRN